MSTTEETVQTESAPATGKDAFAAARASITAQSPDQGVKEVEPTEPDDTPVTETPAEDPAKVADQPTEPTEEPTDALLTPAELAALPAKERARAEKWQAKLTRQAQANAAQAKAFDEWKPLIEALKSNPEAAIEELAKQRGLSIARPKQDTPVEDDLPPELAFLKPVLEARENRIEARIRAELAPVKEAQAHATNEAMARETEATKEQFSAKYPGWQKHEAKMLEIGQRIIPIAGKMTDFEYLELLHTMATANISEAERTKKVVEKINKAAQSVEPTTPGVSENRVEHVMPSGLTDSSTRWKAAVAAAKQGHRWTT